MVLREGWKDGWVDHGGGWQGIMGAPGGRRVVGDGLVDHRGSRISLMSSLQGELTHPHHPHSYLQREKERWQNIFGLCVQRRCGRKIFTVPHLSPSNPPPLSHIP